MRKTIIAVIVILLLAVGGWFGYTYYVGEPPQLPAGTARTTQQTEADSAPAASDFDNVIWASGQLEPVQWAGLSPAAGGQIAAIHVAEAEAAQAKLLAGATAVQIAGAEANLATAQAGIATAQAQEVQIQAGVTAAQAQVTIAQAQYAELASHPTAGEIAAAQGDLGVAEAAVRQAQAAYNMVRGDPNIGSRPESLMLQQATEQLNAAQVDVASSQLPAVTAAVQSAQAQVDGAQAALDALMAGATAEEKAIAAAVNSARANLAAAQAQLGQTQITAPFAGQVGALFNRVGKLASPGIPVLMLGDTAQMHVETTDLRETDVTRLSVGTAVEVTFDALPDHLFTGTITRIAPMSNTDKGSTNFQVIIDVADLDPSLRWGMTAFVNITVSR